MTTREMSEIFAVMILAYPNAKMFEGGIKKMLPTIQMWTRALPDLDAWTGQQAVFELARECEYPPTIAQFRRCAQRIKDKHESQVKHDWLIIRDAASGIPGVSMQALSPIAKQVVDKVGLENLDYWKFQELYGKTERLTPAKALCLSEEG